MRNRKVIYTSLTGGYDNLPQYEVVDESFDYICFTNDLPDGSKQGIWTIKKIPFESEDLTRLSRYVKLLPHKVLSEYDYSVWMDSNLIITGKEPYRVFNGAISEKFVWGGIMHPELDCLYDDAKKCIELRKAEYSSVKKQIRYIKKCGYPRHNGLFENNIILRAHNDKIITQIDEEWWDIYMTYTKRDQLSLCFVFWRHNFKPSLLYPKGVTTHNADGIKRKCHVTKHRSFIIKCRDHIQRKFNMLRVKCSVVFR